MSQQIFGSSWNETSPVLGDTLGGFAEKLDVWKVQLSETALNELKNIEAALVSNTGTEAVAMQAKYLEKLTELEPGKQVAYEKLKSFLGFVSDALNEIGVDGQCILEPQPLEMEVDALTGLQGISQFVIKFNHDEHNGHDDKLIFTFLSYSNDDRFAISYSPAERSTNSVLLMVPVGENPYRGKIHLVRDSGKNPEFNSVAEGLQAFTADLPKEKFTEILVKD